MNTFPVSIYNDMTFQEYLRRDHYISSGCLKKADVSMAHFKAYRSGQLRCFKSAAIDKGTLFHELMEVGLHEFRQRYLRGIKCDKRTNAGKAEWAEFQASCGAKIALSPDEWDALMEMHASVYGNFDYLLSTPARRESSLFWVHPETGVDCKCRPDWWSYELSLVIDFKTTADASYYGFQRQLWNLKYHLAVPHYLEGTGATQYSWLAVESEPPYLSVLYPVSDSLIEYSTKRRNFLLSEISRCIESREFEGYRGGNVQTMELPSWVVV